MTVGVELQLQALLSSTLDLWPLTRKKYRFVKENMRYNTSHPLPRARNRVVVNVCIRRLAGKKPGKTFQSCTIQHRLLPVRLAALPEEQ